MPASRCLQEVVYIAYQHCPGLMGGAGDDEERPEDREA